MMAVLVSQIAAYLHKRGPATTAELAKAFKVGPVTVSDAIRRKTTQRRYGIHVIGQRPAEGPRYATPANIWAVDGAVYRAYIRNKRKRSSAQSVKTPKELYRPAANAPAYSGPSLTRWLPSSPYYKENT